MSKRKALLKAIPFVVEAAGQLSVHPEAAAFLNRVEAPFGVVVIAGVYRSGKSFLLNRGILKVHGTGAGFDTGNSINACTKGIWLYPEIVESEGRRLLVLDSEGTRSLTASSDADSRLIALSMLLSSAFVYNSSGSIDESALSALGVFAAVAKSIAADQPEKYKPPELIWVLRDFHLHVQSECGQPMTADEYLEKALHAKDGDDMRSTLRDQFPSRTLWPLVRPVDKESDLSKLETLTDSRLRPEFVAQLSGFRQTLFRRAPTMCIGTSPLGGKVYLDICSHLCVRINEGHVPSVLDTYGFLVENEILRYTVEIERVISSAFDQLCCSLPVPPCRVCELASDLVTEKAPSFEKLISEEAIERAAAVLGDKVTELQDRVAHKNEEAGMKWIRRAKGECERTDQPLPFVRSHLENSPATVGDRMTLNTLPLFLDIVYERLCKKEAQALDEASTARDQNTLLVTKLERVERECSELRTSIECEILKTGDPGNMAKDEYDRMEALMAEKTQQIARLESECEEHRHKGDAYEDDGTPPITQQDADSLSNSEALERLHKLTFKLKDVEERYEHSREQLATAENEHKEELDRSVRELQESAQVAQREHERVALHLQGDLEELRRNHASLGTELDILRCTAESKSEEVATLRSKILDQAKHHEEESERARSEAMEKFRAGVCGVSAGVEDIRRELTETRARALAAECGKAQSEGTAQNLKRRLGDADTEIGDLKRHRSDLETARRTNTELTVSNRSLEAIAEDLRLRCRSLEVANRELQKDMAASDRKHAVEMARLEILLGKSVPGMGQDK